MKKRILLLLLSVMISITTFAQTKNVTFQVSSPDSTPVYVFGSWSGWTNWPGTPMNSLGNNEYSITIPMGVSTTYEYLFVNGVGPTKEVLDPTGLCTNGNAQFTNRVLNLGGNDTAICFTWETCTACQAAPPTNVNVRFNVTATDSLPVFVFGSWSGWSNWPGEPMTDANNDGTYDAVVSLTANTTYEFLFVNGVGPTKEVLNPAWTCTNGNGQYTNRVINVGTTNKSVCYTWETCDTCISTPPPSNINVTFRVQNPDSTPVYLIGNWNWANWPGIALTNEGNGVYSTVMSLGAETTIEYLFTNGNGPTKEVLNPSWTCTNGNAQYTNRMTTLGTSDITLCAKWAKCDNCVIASVNESNNEKVSIYLDQHYIKLFSSEITSYDELQIFDLTGRKVVDLQKNISNNIEIPLELNNNSLYIVKLRTGNTVFTLKGKPNN